MSYESCVRYHWSFRKAQPRYGLGTLTLNAQTEAHGDVGTLGDVGLRWPRQVSSLGLCTSSQIALRGQCAALGVMMAAAMVVRLRAVTQWFNDTVRE